jgi:glycosyltransferase involved in cell wall biosynthesis
LTGGGAERFTSHLLTHLSRELWEPRLAIFTGHVTYDLPSDIPRSVLQQEGWRTSWRTIQRLRRQIHDFQPDVVLSTIDYATLFTGLALRGVSPRPRWIARLGLNTNRESFSLRDRVSRFVLRFLYRQVDHFVANSQGLAEQFQRQFRIDVDRITTIYNPIDAHQLDVYAADHTTIARDDSLPLIVFAGRLHRQKRPDLLLDAYGQLRATVKARLWILGDGPLRDSLQTRIEQQGWQDEVQLLGFQANPFPFLAAADVFLLTSDHEGMPNALLEAQALGVPAVATRCPFGPAEIIDDPRTGRLVPRGDAAAIAAALQELLVDSPLRQQISQQAREHVRTRFAIRPILQQWERVIGEPPGPA